MPGYRLAMWDHFGHILRHFGRRTTRPRFPPQAMSPTTFYHLKPPTCSQPPLRLTHFLMKFRRKSFPDSISSLPSRPGRWKLGAARKLSAHASSPEPNFISLSWPDAMAKDVLLFSFFKFSFASLSFAVWCSSPRRNLPKVRLFQGAERGSSR